LQVILVFALLSIGLLASALYRIRANLSNTNSDWEANTRFTIYHIVAFSLFTFNILVYDVLILMHPEQPIPQGGSLVFRVFNITLPITNLIS
jgi:heme/copper-type cytochrome/quinol oxidase subunit 2